MTDLHAITLNRALNLKQIKTWGTDHEGRYFVQLDEDHRYTFQSDEAIDAFCHGLLAATPVTVTA